MRQPVRVLLVEDDRNLRAAVRAELVAAGFEVTGAGDLAGADAELRRGGFACVVFDRMLPDGDALDYVRRRRLAGWDARVLFLTARDRAADRVDGFTHGGDDYVVKPFSMAELTARVRSLCRPGGSRPAVLRFADLEIDCARRETRRAGVLLTLSGREFSVLEHLAVRPGQAVSRTDLIEHCWDESADPMSNVVDAVVKRLRRKLREPNLIHAVRGHGYRLGFAEPAS
ncbi:response regulator transcription factor [Amycolatopsis jiangsuensis]|uniref:DNA-binding response OmpR family regulator n=1 Tax=Amycolatopsis jiangsuensis TaxID=1181879 RepID=A0A840J2T7_9PSEU|nr:response regulator transcription factor [Amycolatopsis jiangsuensis]MBB4688370.1 DNA-binding response OmpR family regulator [Amycolatopsis jiangsuensis]